MIANNRNVNDDGGQVAHLTHILGEWIHRTNRLSNARASTRVDADSEG